MCFITEEKMLHPPFPLVLAECALSFLILQQMSLRAGSDFAAAQWGVPSVHTSMDHRDQDRSTSFLLLFSSCYW